jgi:hypothetical protein
MYSNKRKSRTNKMKTAGYQERGKEKEPKEKGRKKVQLPGV